MMSFFLSSLLQVDSLSRQSSQYQQELSKSNERLSSETERVGSLCKEM